MAENEEQAAVTSGEAEKKQGFHFPMLLNFPLKFPQFPPFPPLKQETKEATEKTSVVEEESKAQKPDVVRFPDTRLDFPPLKLELDESAQEASSRNLWQVYALGGFLVLRWIWARWKERRPKDESSGEPSAGDD